MLELSDWCITLQLELRFRCFSFFANVLYVQNELIWEY